LTSAARSDAYGADMARYVIDAPTLLHLVTNGVKVSPSHQLVAPNLIRSQALSLLFSRVRDGELIEDVALQHHADYRAQDATAR
jgi:hypothetical protein